MAIAITSATQPAPETAAQNTAAAKRVKASPKPAQAQAASKASAPADTVKISTAAQTALQEATETRAQTAQEANHGDQQAARLLAKETAAKKS
jgi:hypothetical protein